MQEGAYPTDTDTATCQHTDRMQPPPRQPGATSATDCCNSWDAPVWRQLVAEAACHSHLGNRVPLSVAACTSAPWPHILNTRRDFFSQENNTSCTLSCQWNGFLLAKETPQNPNVPKKDVRRKNKKAASGKRQSARQTRFAFESIEQRLAWRLIIDHLSGVNFGDWTRIQSLESLVKWS